MFDAAMVRSLIDIKTFEADVPDPELPGLVKRYEQFGRARREPLYAALTGAEQIAPTPTRLGFHRLSWPDTAPHPFA